VVDPGGNLVLGQNIPYFSLAFGFPDAGNQALWRLQAPDQDENPPHVHIKGPDFAAKIRLSNGELIAGNAPNRVLREARRWLQEHRSELLQLWNEFQR
jgi:hypothetical protein